MATLAEVAKKAGVSTATVSKVLSNTPYFSEETRQKVMAAVHQLGYVPNLAGRALSSGKTHIIAVVFPRVYDTLASDPFTQHILVGIEEECSARGYNLLLSMPRLSPDGPDDNYERLIRSGYLDGIVALDNVPVSSVFEAIHAFKIPAVSIGYGEHDVFVRSDDAAGARQLMAYVISQGHRHIGILTVPEELHMSIGERMTQFREVAHAHGVKIRAEYYGDFSIQSGAAAMHNLIADHPEISAVVCINDRMAFGAIQEAHRQGLTVPYDISVAGYDDIPMAALIAPPLTTISQNGPEIGRTATQLLFQILEGEQPESVTLPPELIIRQSVAPPNS